MATSHHHILNFNLLLILFLFLLFVVLFSLFVVLKYKTQLPLLFEVVIDLANMNSYL